MRPVHRPDASHVRRRAGRLLRWAGVGLLGGTVAAAAAWNGQEGPVVVAGVVPRRWHGLGALLILALTTLLASAALRQDGAAPPGARPSRPAVRRRAEAAAVAVLSIAAVASLVMVYLIDAVTTYHVLNPTSPDGCRLVVAENSFLLLGSGTIYALPAGEHRPRAAASYSADDGYRPITFGTYSLDWNGETADLQISGTLHQPVEYDAASISC